VSVAQLTNAHEHMLMAANFSLFVMFFLGERFRPDTR